MPPIKDLKMEHDAVQMTLRILDKIWRNYRSSTFGSIGGVF